MRLLVVDDEPIIRNGLLKMAQQYAPAFDMIETAANGAEAMERIAENEPDIVLTDIRMPKVDGLELCRYLYQGYSHIQTVVISGFNDFDYAQKCLSYGVKHYLLKPVIATDLHELFDQLMKAQLQGYVPMSRYVEWIERMEEHIWSLQVDEMSRMYGQWREQCAHLNAQQLRSRQHDAMEMLYKRFLEKNRPIKPGIRGESKAQSKAELFAEFEAGLQAIADGLSASRKGNFKDPMQEAKAYIDSHLSQEITLKEVAEMVGLTPTYFSALFKKLTNENFVSYRINRRMEKACELLAFPHLRTVDVAAEVGYDDYPHFTKTFKKIVGVSPSEYRGTLGIK
ncbi:two-component system, response regulator YesN [Paenibacillus sp. UNCCL117]|uniref:response regulator n=1 Tax=unclassified Paenibacillus TaxID=185978 RepID=UPI0008909017|nr:MULTISPECIES: response regulator [unclassified Paenibacillus]SDC05749.1 two-component system, response regulator YesN [Paenibacillus sp. cl123]SFW37657.1 two-component system, response regulator YesN [Paenibacillus sp. UNCCL117]